MILTNEHGLPEQLVRTMESWNKPRKLKGYSVTELIGPPKIAQLRKRHEGERVNDVLDLIWSTKGKALHLAMEAGAGRNDLTEERLAITVDGETVTGQPDLYDGDTKTVWDWKETSVWKIIMGSVNDWEAQVNLYAHLLRSHGFEVKALRVLAFLKDWKKNDAKFQQDYPKKPAHIINLNLWTPEDCEAYLKERVQIHVAASHEMIDDNIPECTEEERWAKPNVFAVMKDGRKAAVKLFDNLKEAETMAKGEKGLSVVNRPGFQTRCVDFCDCSEFCHFGRGLREGK